MGFIDIRDYPCLERLRCRVIFVNLQQYNTYIIMKAFLFVLCMPALMFAQKPGLDNLAKRQAAFAGTIPQEKVYIHMDNTCYFQGDTIWFAAYTRQTNTSEPSEVSVVLYVELLNSDGYLVERKQIEMNKGRGSGFFALNNMIQYSGFYELRAYTRWQLNWGEYEHPHPGSFGLMFRDKEMERLYFRDYDKLYSRVFPVYDKPLTPGDYTRDMTLRVLRREFKDDPDKRRLRLSLFPEGGNLVAGVENRVAFEASMSDGEQVEGILTIGGEQVRSVNRGRGVFSVTPEKGMEREVVFVAENGERVTAKLPKPEEKGVSLHVVQAGDSAIVRASLAGLCADSLALTIMHEGKAEEYHVLGGGLNVSVGGLCAGIHQATVFDAGGRVWADRLFFVRVPELSEPTLTISGQKDEYAPYEKVELKLTHHSSSPLRGDTVGSGPSISLAVRDDYQADRLFDNGNIMTEMLLCSEIRGFIPNPGWYFERDDEEHRAALDLLMMTQGWRRFVWRDMAVPGEWDLTQPNERTPVLMGKVHFNPNRISLKGIKDLQDTLTGKLRWRDYKHAVELAKKKITPSMRVHSEIVHLETNESTISEETYSGSQFKMPIPRFYGDCVLFLSAADTANWEKDKREHTWIQMAGQGEEYPLHIMRKLRLDEADFRPCISWPYPRFVKPYDFYQSHMSNETAASDYGIPPELLADSTKALREVSVTARRRSRLKGFDDAYPAFIVDAYDAWNEIEDAGVPIFDYKDIGKAIVRVYLNDYGVNEEVDGNGDDRIRTSLNIPRKSLPLGTDIPLDSLYHPKYLASEDESFAPSPGEIREFFGDERIGEDQRFRIDKYVVYTDYQPRLEGSIRYTGATRPETRIAVYPFCDGGMRAVYRDRRYILKGFAYPAQFYSPDYSKHRLPEGQADYRRTLYWNPDVQLDENGEATVTFYNNSRQTTLSIEAEGQASDGTLLWGKW